MPRVIVMAGNSLGQARLDGECWQWCRTLATELGEPVLLATMNEQLLPVSEFVFPTGMVTHGEVIRPAGTPTRAPMSPAPFVYGADGAPDWGAMWTTFCDLALYGGPPHRGEEQSIRASAAPAEPASDGFDAVAELRRGIWLTTGLDTEVPPEAPGWLAVQCHSTKMAAWLCATIILENVEARCEGAKLYVPARADYALADEVKSVITVVAKTNHYWQTHVLANQPAPALTCRPDAAPTMQEALSLA